MSLPGFFYKRNLPSDFTTTFPRFQFPSGRDVRDNSFKVSTETIAPSKQITTTKSTQKKSRLTIDRRSRFLKKKKKTFFFIEII